jgi:hypothetical protein
MKKYECEIPFQWLVFCVKFNENVYFDMHGVGPHTYMHIHKYFSTIRAFTSIILQKLVNMRYFYRLRLKNCDSIIKEVSTQVRSDPILVSHVPQALPYLVTTDTLLSDAHEVSTSLLYYLAACM